MPFHGYPPYMKVEIGGDVPVIAKTVADLFSLSAWPPGLILNFPSCGDRYPESVVVVERASWRQLTEIRRHRGLSDRIASVFLLLALFGKQIDYLLSV